MAIRDGQDGIPAEETVDHCAHPSSDVVYHYEITDDGGDYEEYWCRRCNRWIPNAFMEEIRMRADWTGSLSEDEAKSEQPHD